MNYRQKNLSFIVGAVLVLLVLGWLGGNQIAVVPKQDGGANPNNSAQTKEAIVTKVLDGDTIIVQGGIHVRLLGIDADEKDSPCYDSARQRLEELILGKTVVLEMDNEGQDQYGRQLRFVFLNGVNINQQLVAEGMAIARFYPENQKYKAEIVAAEAEAIKNKTGCKWEGRS
ncbi:MAG: thermonuclease family protein [Candidatus Paceibacterota bacterium]